MSESRKSLEEYVDSLDDFGDWEFSDEEKIPTPSTWKEVDALDFPEDRWLVPDLFPREGFSIVASVSGEGKSLILMHLAKCLSEGSAWFGHEGFKTQPARVLYVNLEMSVSEMQRRGRKIGFDTENENLILLNEDDFNLNAGGPGREDLKYKWFMKYIYDHDIKVVMVDTFRAASGGLKEDKAEEVRSFFLKFQLLKNAGVSVIFLEHLRKPNQLEGKVPKKEQLLGSQDKTANMETLLMIRRDETTGDINLYQRKNRLGAEVQPFSVRVSDVVEEDGTERIVFEYLGEIADDATKKEEAKELVKGILADGAMKDRKELGELTKNHVGDKNLRAALSEMRTTGEVDIVKDGKKFMYFISSQKEKEPEPVSNEDEDAVFNDI